MRFIPVIYEMRLRASSAAALRERLHQGRALLGCLALAPLRARRAGGRARAGACLRVRGPIGARPISTAILRYSRVHSLASAQARANSLKSGHVLAPMLVAVL